MYVLIAGGGKVGANVTRSLLRQNHEVTIIEQRPDRFRVLEEEFDYRVQRGDATELHVLEQAGIGVVGLEGVDVIGEAGFLADLDFSLAQARGACALAAERGGCLRR